MSRRKLTRSPLQIVAHDLRQLVPYERNARTHPQEQIDQIARSLETLGWASPIKVAGHDILAGHGTVVAALQLARADKCPRGWPDRWTAPTVDLSHLSRDEQRAYVLADNKLAEKSGWNDEMLRVEIAELTNTTIDLSMIGFDVEQLRDIVYPVPKATKSSRRGLSDNLQYQVIVECAGEADQATILAELRGKGIKCKPMIL